MSAPHSPNAPDSPLTPAADSEKDASRKEVIYYALGGVEGTFSNVFFNTLSTIMIVALGMDPLLLGLILAVRTFWDGFIDPSIAQISDRTRSRWGRRRPFILVGGIGRVLLLLAIFLFFPRDESIKTNAELGTSKAAQPVAAAPAAPSPAVETSAADSTPPLVANDTPPSPAAELATPPPEPAPPAAAPSKKPAKPGFIESIRLGVAAFFSAENAYHRHVAVYLLFACLLFATISSVNDVAYYALGIELCPSYDGRTRVVTYRSVVQKLGGMLTPWVLPFCLWSIFHNVLTGLSWYAGICIALGVPATILMVRNTHERRLAVAAKKGPGFFVSIWQTARNVHFLKALFLFKFVSLTNSTFTQIGTLLTIYWVYRGNAQAGTVLGGFVGTLGSALAFAALPLANWACRRLQKHRALRFAILWMSVGTALKWWLIDPEHPYLQLILPFFFSVGISSVFVILPSMMADVTDIDELENGVRREGMFGAVMSLLSKLLGTLQPVLAGLVLHIAGFDAALGADQPDSVIFRMRVMYALVPAVMLLGSLVLLWRYPLTRDYMAEVKQKLVARRAAAAAQAAGAST